MFELGKTPEETRRKVKDRLVAIVEQQQGCKAMRLAMDAAHLPFTEGEDFPELLQELIDAGELVEVEYVLPNLDFRAKSFLLPAGSTARGTPQGALE